MLGVLFAILSAASFGLNTASIRRGVLRGSALQGVYVTVYLGVPLFVLAAAATGQLFKSSLISATGYLLLVIAGVLHFLFGRYCGYRAISALGATRASPIESLATALTVVLALLFLNERLTLMKGVGILLVLIGPALIVQRSSHGSAGSPRRTRALDPPVAANGLFPRIAASAVTAAGVAAPIRRQQAAAGHPPVRLAEGVFFALLNAAAFGTSPILIRSALSGTGLGILGALVSYLAAAIVLLPSLALPGQISSLQQMDRATVRWFILGAVTVFSAQMFRFLALSVAPASVVTPLQRTGIVFTLFFAWLINRRTESFNPTVILGIVLSLLGAVAVAL